MADDRTRREEIIQRAIDEWATIAGGPHADGDEPKVTLARYIETVLHGRVDGRPCGSERVTQRFHELEQEVRWCERRSGPCPFTGTTASKYAAITSCAADQEARRA